MPSASGAAVCEPFNELLYVAAETTAASTNDANISNTCFISNSFGFNLRFIRVHLRLKPERVTNRRIRSWTIDPRSHRAVVPVKDIFEDDGERRTLTDPETATHI